MEVDPAEGVVQACMDGGDDIFLLSLEEVEVRYRLAQAVEADHLDKEVWLKFERAAALAVVELITENRAIPESLEDEWVVAANRWYASTTPSGTNSSRRIPTTRR